MKLKFLFFLISIQLMSICSKGYDLFLWNNMTAGANGQKFVRFGPDDSLYVGSSRGLHVYKDSTVNYYNFFSGYLYSVNSIAFDNNGISWLGTSKGLVKRTGAQYQIFDTSNSGISSNYVTDILVSGSLVYIACNNGLSVYDGLVWSNISTASLGLDQLNSVGRNSFGIYLMDTRGRILFNDGSNWLSVNVNPLFGYNVPLSKFRSLNQDTLLIPSMGGYIVDSVVRRISIPVDPCLFKDELGTTPFIISNPITNEKFVTINEGITMDSKFLVKADNFQINLNDIRRFSRSGLSIQIAKLAYATDLFDFDSAGKLFWVYNSNPRGIYSVNLSLDSFPLEIPYDVCPYLDINQVRAKIMNDGGMFWDYSGDALYEVPKGSGISSIFCQGLWIGGLDQNNQLHIAAQTYRQSGADFWPGPLDTVNASIDSVTNENFDSIWKIDRSTVDNFIWRFATGQVQNGSWTIPDIILNWPAEGSGNYSRNLAPYYDFNQDGHYNPYDGDYPDVKGSQMIWSVFNDNFGTHGTNLSDRNLGVEIQNSAYAYNCPMAVNDDSVINYTTFYQYEIINRSDTDYHDVYVGIFTDVDLGDYLDDYVGCDTVNDYGFAYNGDDDDGGSYFSNPPGYGLHPPMINNLVLRGPQADPLDGLDNDHDGLIDEQGENCMMSHFSTWYDNGSNTSNPSTAWNYYGYLQSLWLDSSHVTIGGNGLGQGNQNTNYMYSGIPYNGMMWTELVADSSGSTNSPGSQHFIITSGPFDLKAHEKKTLDFAYVYTRDPNSPNGLTTSIAKNTRDVLRIKQFYESNSFPCDNVISVNEIEKIHASLFPNPADQFIEIEHTLKPYSNAQLRITDILGQIIYEKQLQGERKLRYSTAHLAPGIYLMNIFSGDQMVSRKFVVQHGE